MILIKNVKTFKPEAIGQRDLLIAGGKFIAVDEQLDISYKGLKVIDGENLIAVPGFIDSHVHILGGGGEGGFKTRTPEIKLSDMIGAGVTTVVGCIGTDGISRRMESLVAKAKGLKEEGVSAYVYSGSYRLPIATLTDDVMKDLLFIEEIIGVGEIAISDHRSSQPGYEELSKLSADTRTAGILSNKAGILNVHLGDSEKGLKPILEVVENTEIPISQYLPTHINRNQRLFKEGIDYAKNGGYIDFTTSTTKQFIEAGEVEAPLAIKKAMISGVSINQITLSSDGQGSLPAFDNKGNFTGLEVGTSMSLYNAFKKAVKVYGVSMADALMTITKNPADILKLVNKGEIKENLDADLVLLDDALNIKYVLAKGKIMLEDGTIIKKGTFE
jgi:beta-aspartyl-dipeptidase (metallo-type)